MKYITILFLAFSVNLYAAIECEFSEGNNQGTILIDDNFTSLDLSMENKNKISIRGCKKEKDQFGTLIDCSSHKEDMMVILNSNQSPLKGGLMSHKKKLYVDLKC